MDKQIGLMSSLESRTSELNESLVHLEEVLFPVLRPMPDSERGKQPIAVGGSREPAPRLLLEQIDERLALLTGRLRTLTSRVGL